MSENSQSEKELMSFGYGYLGVTIFSLTLPATRIALTGFDPIFVGLGRAIVAAGLSLPVLMPIVWQHLPSNFSSISLDAMLGFLYVSFFSMFLGFFAWYRGLALGGIARIGQIQLIQPFLTILASAIFLGEQLTISTLGFAAAVIVCVALGKRTQISASGT